MKVLKVLFFFSFGIVSMRLLYKAQAKNPNLFPSWVMAIFQKIVNVY